MHYVAVDVGTSFIKGAIVDVEAIEIRNVIRLSSPSRLESSEPVRHELDPLALCETVREVINQLLALTPDCQGILMCGQMGGLVLCDETGTALRPCIAWLDGRAMGPHPSASETLFEAFAKIVGDRSRTIFGNEFRPALPFAFLYSLHALGELDDFQNSIPVTIPDYVAAALCQTKPVMEYTTATGMLDLNLMSFPPDVITDLQLPQLTWPELVDFRHVVGKYQSQGRSIPVYAPTGDHQCSLAGTLLGRDELSINVSTGSQVSRLAENADTGEYQIRPYFDGMYLKTITNIPAGRAITAIVKLLTELGHDRIDEGQAWTEFFEKSEQTSASDLEVNLALFPGAVQGPGMLSNLREDNLTVGHLGRACLEQMAIYYEEFAKQLSPQQAWSRIAFSGGIAQRSRVLRDLVAERLDSDYRVATTTEDALHGLLVLGRVIAGLNSTVAEAIADVTKSP